ncbi:hypothetical protein KC343_g4940 [Hortaea werneckii]|nr:hypothetical protein KC352_g18396 [Hortaea werneckii]KAI7567129.1 hypothetical protein KC317_g5196 [Hortaea werneckii]KAI7620612.1 hypothetical protein KC346_g4009 [Hortaea werneckii]KAI7629940.1 hypothetical protein KC343_g4940 [Hortaea werneckii]KAI7677560.1 hypothetical protein KC319_g3832 [Hortaea werneckii]
MEAIVSKFREDMGALTRRLQASPLTESHASVSDIRDMIRRGDGVTHNRGQSRKDNPHDEESSSEDKEETIPRTRPEQSITTTNDTPSQGGFDARLQYLHTLWEGMKKRAETVPVVRPVDLKDHIQPYQHQLQGTAVCLHAEKTVFDCQLPKWDLEKSNTEFDKDFKSIGLANEDKSYGGGDEEKQVNWASLIRAQQYAYHPELVRMMELERKMANQHLTAEGILEPIQMTTNEEKDYLDWKKSINEGEKSRSARVDVIIDIVGYSRDIRPGYAILILNESTFFLDVLEAAFAHVMCDPVKVSRYGDRHGPAEPYLTLQAFSEASGTRIMLTPRSTGGQGLNLQAANVVIRCGAWWKKSWEEHADHRVYRPGQTKPVTIYELRADHCKVETYKVKRRDKKNKTNGTIMDMVKMEDGVVPSKWDGP